MEREAIDPRVWPLPVFYFKVTISDVGEMSFKEVSGLNMEHDVIEYRSGDERSFTKIKIPGLIRHMDVTLKKGIFVSDQNFWSWISEVKQNVIRRHTVTISLLNETDEPLQTWVLANAWPKKITVNGFNTDGNTVAMETLELVHEGISIK